MSTSSSINARAHDNNFSFVRPLLATLVLITHSYPLTGLPETDWLYYISHGQTIWSEIGVACFMVISGYLITKTLLRSPDLSTYYFKRVMRVFPGMWVLLLVTVVVCFFLSGKALIPYLLHYSPRDYFVFNAILKTNYFIEGVFTNNPYPKVINGSLWTIPVEFFFYIVVSSYYLVRSHIKVLRLITFAVFATLALLALTYKPTLETLKIPFWNLGGFKTVELGALFFGGALWSLFAVPSVKQRNYLAAAGFALLLASILVGGFTALKFLAIPLFVVPFGTLRSRLLTWADKLGDISYGVYLYGFFVQQLLAHFFQLNVTEMIFWSIPATYLCGWLSWHLVEKHALKWKWQDIKNYLRSLITSRANAI